MRNKVMLVSVLWTLATLAAFAVAIVRLVEFTPTEQTMGEVQKIFYVHFPVAINMFLGCTVTFVGSIGYLITRRLKWDDLAAAGGKLAAVYGIIVLATGSIWGRSAWGVWWTWSPKLTFALVLWLLYLVYVVIRTSVDSPQRRAVICAVYGIIAFLDVPLVYLSSKLMPKDIHPLGIDLAPAMQVTRLLWILPVLLTTIGLIWGGYRIARNRRRLAEGVAK